MVRVRGYVWCGISSVVSAFVLWSFSVSHVYAQSHKDLFYVGLWYGPTISEVSEFSVGVPGETKKALPILDHSGLRGSDNFDWRVESDPVINFRRTNPYGLRGGIGYGAHSMRMEVEFGHEKYDVISRKGGETFLLAKTAALSVLTEQGRASLPLALESFTVEEFGNWWGYIYERFKDDQGFKGASDKLSGSAAVASEEVQEETLGFLRSVTKAAINVTFDVASLLFGLVSSSTTSASSGTVGAVVQGQAAKASKTQDELSDEELVAEGVAFITELAKLSPEKVKLAKTISLALEGAEVVEIGSLRSTSVMLNACYDFPQVLALGWYMSPYLCGGGGISIVSLGGGHLDFRPAYRVKLGINYSFSETFSMFAGGVYHGVLGREYDDIPASRMEGDITFVGRTKESVSAQFELRYWGVEVGVRYAF